MNQRLTIHIGVPKTGTSAIQGFLKKHAERLRDRGIVVPDGALDSSAPVNGHQVWYFAEMGRAPSDHATEVAQKIRRLFAAGDTKQVVISAESLTTPTVPAHQLFHEIADEYDTEVVVYLRRQDELLLTSWPQWWGKVQTDFWAWLISVVGLMGNWQTLLQKWESAVGRERMRVNLYEREKLADGDIVADFRRFLVADTDDLEMERSIVNPSFNEAVTDLIVGGGFFEDAHDNSFYRFLEDHLGESCYKTSGETTITFEQRKAILNRYRETNAWVRANYFSSQGVPETLFTMPRPGDYTLRLRDDIRKEQIQMLARLIFKIGKGHR